MQQQQQQQQNNKENGDAASEIISQMATMNYKESDVKDAIKAVGTNQDAVLDYLLEHAKPELESDEILKKEGEEAFIEDMVKIGLKKEMVKEAVKEVGLDSNKVQMFIATKMSENEMLEKAKIDSLRSNREGDEELQLQQAIAASLTTQPGSSSFFSASREEKERAPGMPVGLFNTGATCYFNTFVQTYFAIPPIKKYFLEMDKELIDAIASDFKDSSDHFKTEDCINSTVEFKDFTENDMKYLSFECTLKHAHTHTFLQLLLRCCKHLKTIFFLKT